MTDFEKVIDFHNMYRAFRKAKRGKGYKRSSARFDLSALGGVNELIGQLKNKTYRISDYFEFKVYEPKERNIQTASFKDKVVQHSLCDNVLLPKMQRIFIRDNCAGQKGKGTLFGLDRLREQMKQFYEKYGTAGYILKCDIAKFFYSISHPQLKDIVHYHFGYDRDLCWLCDLFIDSTEGKGLPLGNQINQGFALLYLDGMDKLIKYELGIEYYGRYMDDFYLIHPSKEYLKHCLQVISAYLETLDLKLNGKTQIFPFKNGVSYLGFHTYVTTGGRVFRRLKNQNKRNARKQKLTDEYYADPEVQEKHLNDRLRQMGFTVTDGRLLATMDENGDLVKAAADAPAQERKTQDLWNGWISVLDKLPEVFKPVILCRNTPEGYKVEQGMREVNGWWKVYGTRTKNVDWWMDLPKPPSGRK